MTKLFIFFVFLFLSACSEPETIEPTTPDSEQEADLQDVEVKIDNNYSRAAAVASNTLQIFWSKGDKITLTDLEQRSDYTLSSGAGSSNARFSGNLKSDSEYIYAIYPSEGVTISGSTLTFDLPTSQSFAAAKDANIGAKTPMVGQRLDSGTFTMQGVASAVKFDITLTELYTIESVTLTSAINPLVGKATYTLAEGLQTLHQRASSSHTLSLPRVRQGMVG